MPYIFEILTYNWYHSVRYTKHQYMSKTTFNFLVPDATKLAYMRVLSILDLQRRPVTIYATHSRRHLIYYIEAYGTHSIFKRGQLNEFISMYLVQHMGSQKYCEFLSYNW